MAAVLSSKLGNRLCNRLQAFKELSGLQRRFAKFQAHDAGFDPEELSEARRWHQTFEERLLPPGETSFSRSSGPGGQHVNK
jgi:hypothetical protein